MIFLYRFSLGGNTKCPHVTKEIIFPRNEKKTNASGKSIILEDVKLNLI